MAEPALAEQDVPVLRWPSGQREQDALAVEEPLEIRVDDLPLSVTLRTPGADTELAAGFCFTEGIVDHPDEIERVEPCTLADYGNVVHVHLAGPARERWEEQHQRRRREIFLTSSCGLCGSQTIARLARSMPFPVPCFTLPASRLAGFPAQMLEAQTGFAHTGGLHAAALFGLDGGLQLLREDVGRHNAVDKIIGLLLLSGQLPGGPAVLQVSGRASFELVQKAARAGIGVLAAVGAPSSLAVQAAEQLGITLAGFVRADRFNVYTHAHRLCTGVAASGIPTA